MSRAEHMPDESATNRVYLCLFLLFVALLGFGSVGLVPPQPREVPPVAGPQGVVVLKHADKPLKGVVLERGAAIKVIGKDKNGATTIRMIPRSQVRYAQADERAAKPTASSERPAPPRN